MEQIKRIIQRLDSRDVSRDSNGQFNGNNETAGTRRTVGLPGDKVKDVMTGTLPNQRIKALKELSEFVTVNRISHESIGLLFSHTADILNACHYGLPEDEISSPVDNSSSLELRKAAWTFYKNLVNGQMENLNSMRIVFFNLIKNYPKHNTDEVMYRLELLKALTENGKNSVYFRDDIGSFMLRCYSEEILPAQSALAVTFLGILINIIKTNSPYLESKTIVGIILITCKLIETTKNDDVRRNCLILFEVFPSCSYLPPETLNYFAQSLCLTVTLSDHRDATWKIMNNVLHTHLGHAVVKSLCVLLQDRTCHNKINVLCGAIHFIGMSLWGEQRISSLKHKPDAILPPLLAACDCRSPLVGYEVATAVHLLIRKQGTDLQIYTWDVVIDICDTLVTNYEVVHSEQTQIDVKTSTRIHNLLSEVEKLQRENCFLGSVEKFYLVLEKCSVTRPEESVGNLIEHRSQNIDPSKAGWIEVLKHFMEIYYKKEKRTSVRIRVLDVVSSILSAYRHTHEEVLIDAIVFDYLSSIHHDCDWKVRQRVVQLLLDIIQDCKIVKKCSELLEVIRNVLNRPFMAKEDIVNVMGDNELSDTMTCISGLVDVFRIQICSAPAFTAIEVYKILVSHLEKLYSDPRSGQDMIPVKEKIIEFLLTIRANSLGQVGCSSNDDNLEYSPFILCSGISDTSNSMNTPSNPATNVSSASQSTSGPTSYCHINLDDMFNVIIHGLKDERCWTVLRLILSGLKALVGNKPTLMFSRHKRQDGVMENKIANELVVVCSNLVQDKSKKYPETLTEAPPKFTKSDFQHQVYPVLETLVIYGKELDARNQTLLIKALQTGLPSRSSQRQCILALTLCIMETQDMMSKLLPEMLLSISKISSTRTLAVPKLEFLSNLILFPRLYQSFTVDQYMSIFAIILPYTNSFHFDEYTIALAHRVIAMWFLKCRLFWRKQFAKFIRKGLEQNITPSEEFRTRVRSGGAEVQSPPVPPEPESQAPLRQAAASGHQHSVSHHAETLRRELFEASMDLLSRYTFGMCSSVPQKTPFAEFLLDRSQSCTWLVGHKLITITTTCCGARAFHKGLCDTCLRICKSADVSIQGNATRGERSDSESEHHHHVNELQDISFQQHRRRHQSATNIRSSDPKPLNRAFDDSHLDSQTSSSSVNPINTCSCWCQGWAEILIRRPTGNSAWVMRIENQLNMPSLSAPAADMSYADLVNFYCTQAQLTSEQEKDFDEPMLPPISSRPIDILPSKSAESQSPGFRRTSSSPEIENGPVVGGVSPVEVGTDLTNETNVAASPEEKRLVRAASLGKNDTHGRHELIRAQSFSVKRPSPVKLIQDEEKRGSILRDSLKSKEANDMSQLANAQHSPTKNLKTPPKTKLPLDDISEQPTVRDRSRTISVMTPANSRPRVSGQSYQAPAEGLTKITGLDPRFVFLQLFYDPAFGRTVGSDRPHMLPKNEAIERAIKHFDHITPYETHKIGVLYVGPGQAGDRTAILANEHGSTRYMEMLKQMGNLVRLKDIDAQTCYIGGLAQDGQDGRFAYCWQDSLTQVVFHVATLMPYKERDPNSNDKVRHIGNDHVFIVYNDSGKQYETNILESKYQMASIIVTPVDFSVNRVEIRTDPSLAKIIGHSEQFMISDQSLALYVRQIAIHVNLAAMVQRTISSGHHETAAYVSNWVERLKQLKRIKQKVLEHSVTSSGNGVSGNSSSSSSHDGSSTSMRQRSNTMIPHLNSSSEDHATIDNRLPEDYCEYT
ncbi:Tuberin [Halotydeus destructor]|nr:Tuberin [Halotydeus destructor]